MPELPEAETVRIGLQSLIVGKTIKKIDYDFPRAFPNDEELVKGFVLGSKIKQVRRRGKLIIIDLSSDYSFMVHLRMTGQLVFIGKNRFGAGHPNDSLVNNLPDKSTRVEVEFDDKSKLFFNDQRKFGYMKLTPSELVNEDSFVKKLGPEPLEDEFTQDEFIIRVKKRSKTSIKAAILDQTVLAGVGNIYADEALWGARIHPATLVKNVSNKKLKVLHGEIKYVLNLSIEKGGSTDRNYVNAEGKKGSYIEIARVFRREGLECPRCGSEIMKIRVAGRGTHYCKSCQKKA